MNDSAKNNILPIFLGPLLTKSLVSEMILGSVDKLSYKENECISCSIDISYGVSLIGYPEKHEFLAEKMRENV